jgi:hypothetical protein
MMLHGKTGRKALPRSILLFLFLFLVSLAALAFAGCGTGDSGTGTAIVVTSLDDPAEDPVDGSVTLRMAIDRLDPGGTITFDPSLDNGTILLNRIATDNTYLYGEKFIGMAFQRYDERNYGKSSLYAGNDLTIDASALPHGITIAWAGGDSSRARVIGVFGNLTMNNVTITGGYSMAEKFGPLATDWTLARGGACAVWGMATLSNCTLAGNRVEGDNNAARDRGAFGGGIYANGLAMDNCVVSGNSVIGYGAAGGGVYSVGGGDGLWYDGSLPGHSSLTRCAVTGNRVTAQSAYGGGVYSDGGGPGSLYTIELTNCTIARNVVEDHPGIANTGQFYYRGGGFYMSNGYLVMRSCTVVENEVTGQWAIFNRKPNMAGGGLAATVGNAHTVESMEIWHSIVAGNTMKTDIDPVPVANDVFTGSLLEFYSYGYNRFGNVDFSQILVPIPIWGSLSRKHYPKVGDAEGVALSDVVAVDNIVRHRSIVSVGADDGQPAVLWYPPAGSALDKIPPLEYTVRCTYGELSVPIDSTGSLPIHRMGDFLKLVVDHLKLYDGGVLGSGFGSGLGDPSALGWHETAGSWPSDPNNYPYIDFWRALDNAIGGTLGDVRIGDDFWAAFPTGSLSDNLTVAIRIEQSWSHPDPIRLADVDQLGNMRPGAGSYGDVGAIELETSPAAVDNASNVAVSGHGSCSMALARSPGSLDDVAGMLILFSPMAWLRAHCIRRIRTSISFRSRRSSTIREVSVSPKW